MAVFICDVCGHVEFGKAPENCPVCWAKKFTQNDQVFQEAMEKSKEGAHKHIPSVKVIKKCGLIPEESCTDVHVRVGETLHPMTDGHFIGWIDCYVDDKYVSRMLLTPDMNPAAGFHLKAGSGMVRIVQLCNLHGHWTIEAEL